MAKKEQKVEEVVEPKVETKEETKPQETPVDEKPMGDKIKVKKPKMKKMDIFSSLVLKRMIFHLKI